MSHHARHAGYGVVANLISTPASNDRNGPGQGPSPVGLRSTAVVSINYERRGSGSPLVLLHGVGHRWQAWEPVIDLLAASHDVVALDLPGFGESPYEGAYNVDGGIKRLLGFFAELGFERPHVAGNSLGGLLSLELAAAGRVASATALSPAGIWNRPQRAYTLSAVTFTRLLVRTPEPVAKWAFEHPVRRRLVCGMMFGRTDLLDTDVLVADMRAFRHADGFWPVVREGWRYSLRAQPLPVPVTIAWGTKDRILPQGQARRARRLFPQAKWVDLHGFGHVPMYDDPELVADVILRTTGAKT